MCIRGHKRRHHGFSLIELIMFIVIVSASVAGVLVAIDRTARASADPLVIKQALAIAEALLEEVELMPFTFCDPDDPHASTAQSATVDPLDPNKCSSAAQVENIGPEGETRYDASTPFDNVTDSMVAQRDRLNQEPDPRYHWNPDRRFATVTPLTLTSRRLRSAASRRLTSTVRPTCCSSR